MQSPSVNVIGGAVAVVALAALFYFGLPRQTPAPAPLPSVVSKVVPAPAPAVVLKPVLVPPPKPVPEVKPPLKFRTVPTMNCDWVPEVERTYSKDQIVSAAEGYGASPDQLSALRACLK